MTVTDVISLIGFFCIFLFCFIIPRYYACLCGHHELVEYLLQNGRFCQFRFETGLTPVCHYYYHYYYYYYYYYY